MEIGKRQCEGTLMRFIKASVFPVSVDKLWQFHERADVFSLLTPPWRPTEIIQPPHSLEIGTRVIAKIKIGPLWQTTIAEHIEYEHGHMFADRMLKGPFSKWLHRHIMTAKGPNESQLTDDIEYELPLGPLGSFFGGLFARRELARVFDYRHRVTLNALT
jgi:uncharacterized protein